MKLVYLRRNFFEENFCTKLKVKSNSKKLGQLLIQTLMVYSFEV